MLEFLKSQNKNLSDVNATHHLGADGQDHITLWPMGAATLTAKDINAQLHNPDDRVSDGVTMKEVDAVPFIAARNNKYVDSKLTQQTQAAAEKQRAQDEMQREQYTQSQENGRAARAQQTAQGDASDIGAAAQSYMSGNAAKNEIAGGMGGAKRWAAVQAEVLKRNPDFDFAAHETDYKTANNNVTTQPLTFLTSLTGHDGKSGNLGELQKKFNSVNPGQTLPALNNAEAWTQRQAGEPGFAGLRGQVLEVQDQIAKVLQGGGSGNGTSDKKLEQAGELFDKGNISVAQAKDVIGSIQPLLNNRRGALMASASGKGDNPFLAKRFGSSTPATITQYSPDGKQVRESSDGGKTWQTRSR